MTVLRSSIILKKDNQYFYKSQRYYRIISWNSSVIFTIFFMEIFNSLFSNFICIYKSFQEK
jgi:hypothetical protein